jgi:hypothetical protein
MEYNLWIKRVPKEVIIDSRTVILKLLPARSTRMNVVLLVGSGFKFNIILRITLTWR